MPSRRSPRLGEKKTNTANDSRPKENNNNIDKMDTSSAAKRKPSVNITKLATHQYPICLKQFKQQFNRNKHMLIHSGKVHKCSNCAYTAHSPYHLTEHEEKCVDSVCYEYPKEGCGLVFDHYSQVYRHMRKSHWTLNILSCVTVKLML